MDLLEFDVDGRGVEPTVEQIEMFNAMTDLQKRMAMNLLKGMRQQDAYLAAGGQATGSNSQRTTANIIMREKGMRVFIDSFAYERIKDTIMGKDEMMERLTRMARSTLDDVLDVNDRLLVDPETGKEHDAQTMWRLKASDDMTNGGMSSVQEMTATAQGIKIKLHDQRAAMKQLSELQGFDAPTEFKGDILHRKTLSDFYAKPTDS